MEVSDRIMRLSSRIIQKYNLAGVAQWKLGFENSSIWQTISDNLQAAS